MIKSSDSFGVDALVLQFSALETRKVAVVIDGSHLT